MSSLQGEGTAVRRRLSSCSGTSETVFWYGASCTPALLLDGNNIGYPPLVGPVSSQRTSPSHSPLLAVMGDYGEDRQAVGR